MGLGEMGQNHMKCIANSIVTFLLSKTSKFTYTVQKMLQLLLLGLCF